MNPLTLTASLRWSVVREMLDELEPRRILEIGCGVGSLGARLARQADYVGLELDAESYALAKAQIEPAGGQVFNGGLDLVSGPFDLVCAFEVVEHIEDDVAAVREWAKVLRPGGSLLLSVPAWPERFGPSDRLVGHYRRYTPEQLDELLRDAGCIQFDHRLYGWPLGYLTEPIRNRIASRNPRLQGDPSTMSARSAESGRFLQPGNAVGLAIRAGAVPFAALQKLRPQSGVGLIGFGRVA